MRLKITCETKNEARKKIASMEHLGLSVTKKVYGEWLVEDGETVTGPLVCSSIGSIYFVLQIEGSLRMAIPQRNTKIVLLGTPKSSNTTIVED